MSSATFTPAWWLPGRHAQTLGARLLRSRRGVRFQRERLELPDGDFLDLDWVEPLGGRAVRRSGGPAGSAPTARPPDRLSDLPLVIVLHGLEGSAQSNYMLEMYRALHREGIAAVGLNFRTCSGEPNRLPRMYHSGETGDLAYVLAQLCERYPERPLGAVGFSLGANVLLKYLGETGERGEGIGGGGRQGAAEGGSGPLHAAAAISVPFDLSAGADYMERGFARVYRYQLMRKLRKKVRQKVGFLRFRIDVERVLAARSFREFDDAGTAPLHDFAGADDYYRRSSCRLYLESIRIPTLLVHSKDDPFLPASAVPAEAELEPNPQLHLRITSRGGHVGFVTGPPWRPGFWAEAEAARFLVQHL